MRENQCDHCILVNETELPKEIKEQLKIDYIDELQD